MTVRSIPSHAAFPLAFASGAAEGKEIRFTVMRATLFLSKMSLFVVSPNRTHSQASSDSMMRGVLKVRWNQGAMSSS